MTEHLEGSKAAASRQQFGQANPCPECGSPGFLDHIDIIDRIQYEHCPDCDHKWSQTEAEVSTV
jgi:hypothetical protein